MLKTIKTFLRNTFSADDRHVLSLQAGIVGMLVFLALVEAMLGARDVASSLLLMATTAMLWSLLADAAGSALQSLRKKPYALKIRSRVACGMAMLGAFASALPAAAITGGAALQSDLALASVNTTALTLAAATMGGFIGATWTPRARGK